jgi:hypothetical protein
MQIPCSFDTARSFLSACRIELTEINWVVADNNKMETDLKQNIMEGLGAISKRTVIEKQRKGRPLALCKPR